jgi:hypothetical protein
MYVKVFNKSNMQSKPPSVVTTSRYNIISYIKYEGRTLMHMASK